MTTLSIELAGVRLANPVILAAGTCGYGPEVADFMDPRGLGAVVTKSITPESREGHPPWRVVDVPGGMMNAIGLANMGLERFLAEQVPAIEALDTVVIGSIAGHSVEDYATVAAAFDEVSSLPIVELNVSCPNTADGRQFGHDPAALRTVLKEVRPVLARTKLLVKLAPDAPDPIAMATAAIEAGADGLTVANTWPAMAIDVETRRSRLSAGRGGLSGPAVHPLAVRLVHEIHRRVAGPAKVPIVGLGGVLDWQGAAEFVLAGATAVGLGTALFVDPRIPQRVARGLDRWVRRQERGDIAELVGAFEP
ncbi:MAG: dihydroorotate dehydrogenase [Planctomycetota bacterium]|jgi:dihydroorotate dehydrogenase (NAD+) catalytic subunit